MTWFESGSSLYTITCGLCRPTNGCNKGSFVNLKVGGSNALLGNPSTIVFTFIRRTKKFRMPNFLIFDVFYRTLKIPGENPVLWATGAVHAQPFTALAQSQECLECLMNRQFVYFPHAKGLLCVKLIPHNWPWSIRLEMRTISQRLLADGGATRQNVRICRLFMKNCWWYCGVQL